MSSLQIVNVENNILQNVNIKIIRQNVNKFLELTMFVRLDG